jgi:hypothetical protein
MLKRSKICSALLRLPELRQGAHISIGSGPQHGLAQRSEASIAFESVCSKQSEGSGQPDKATGMVVHGLLGSG